MPTPETELIAKADADRLETAIAALPLEFRETFVLREIQGLDYREIAEVTAMPLGTVMSRLARARRRLIDTIGRFKTLYAAEAAPAKAGI
jgi:RNA polymerase sigma factor (sigma-70 family)